MCGIVGVYSFGAPLDAGIEARLARMRDSMEHRGPDGAGLWVSPNRRVALAHRRLSIIDLSPAGAQPMTTADESVWITYNGEVYNHAALRQELEGKGRRHRSSSDTETILHAYLEWGVAALDRFHGMWGFALYDSRTERLLLARDRIGIKPLYYAMEGSRLWFASEIKALLVGNVVTPDLEEEALSHYLTYVAAPAPLTMFKGVKKLPAGCYLEAKPTGERDVIEYWDAADRAARATGPLPKSRAEASEAVLELLTRAVRKRLVSDVPFGAFLSGGIDSSATVALMSKMIDRPVRTFTVAFSGETGRYNELEYARLVARKFETEHHEVMIGQKEFEDFIPRLVYHQDEPIADWVSVPLYYLSDLARRSGTIVLLAGEGADEEFGGYESYMKILRKGRLYEPYRKNVPHLARRLVWSAAKRLPYPRFQRSRWAALLEEAAADRELFLSGALAFDRPLRKRLLPASSPLARTGDPYTAVAPYYARLARLLPDAEPLQKMLYVELKHRLPELLLTRIDKMTMAASIEARVPFLDHELVEYAMRLSDHTKVDDDLRPKQVLKDALRGVIPDEIIDRKKVGFSVPMQGWLRGPMRASAEETLRTSRFWDRGLLSREAALRMLEDHVDRKAEHAFPIWNLLNLCLWHDRWFS